MAVTLSLSYVERNDNKLITITDNSTDWGTPTPAGITSLTLDIEITTSNNNTTVYDKINLLTEYGTPATQAEMIFNIDASYLRKDNVAMGTSSTILPDGIYKITYILDKSLATESQLIEYVLMEGNARNKVYEALRTIPILYNCNECKSKEVLDALFSYSYLNSIRAGGYVAKTEELLSQLYVLERLLNYGSSYTW